VLDNFHKKTFWVPRRHPLQAELSAELRQWIFHAASMTKKLQSCFATFSIKLLKQRWETPWPDECGRLGLPPRRYALIREVILFADNKPRLFGRCVIPAATLTGKESCLYRLGTTPLGKVLFSDPFVRRSEFEIALLTPQQELYQKIERQFSLQYKSIWARRSTFYLSGKPLLLTEVFLPGFLQ